MVFPGVMYGYESWTMKKAEQWRIDAFELWCWRRLLRVPWTARRLNQSILKEISPEYSLEGLMLKLKIQYFGHLIWRSDSLWPHGLQHARPPCPSPSPRASQTLVHWVSDAIQPSHPLLSPSPPALDLSQQQGIFLMSQFFPSSGQTIGASASASVLLLNIQDWFPFGLTGLISLQSKGLSAFYRVQLSHMID